MFIGIKSELVLLNNMYTDLLCMVADAHIKIFLLYEFALKSKVVFFSAQEKNYAFNLEDFLKALQKHFSENYFGTIFN